MQSKNEVQSSLKLKFNKIVMINPIIVTQNIWIPMKIFKFNIVKIDLFVVSKLANYNYVSF